MLRIVSFIILFPLAAPASIAATEISGSARILDGDTIEIASTVIRLHGIDSCLLYTSDAADE